MKSIFTSLFLCTTVLLLGQTPSAQNIIDASIKAHGGSEYNNAHFSYDFRKYHYEFHYENGSYRYERHSQDGSTKDILTNEGFKRTEEGKEVELSEKKKRSYSNSVNSVHYFAFLPFFLNDEAVNKKWIGEATIKGKNYYKIQVTFNEAGGGDDHDDVYVYWFDKEDNTMDYLAYSFHVNGGGVRFRAAYNARKVGGIIFQDYINYKHDKTTAVDNLDELYEQNKLTELSKIELKNVRKL